MEPKKSIESLTQRNVAITAEMEKAASQVRTRGERLAEWLASLVGSWTILIVQTLILLSWLTLNIAMWISHWDPYPFILLNLALSFQSAYAAPISMISQNRQAKLSDAGIISTCRLTCSRSRNRPRFSVSCDFFASNRVCRGADRDARAFEEETSHAEIVRQIQGEIENRVEQTIEAIQTAADDDAESVRI